MDNPRLIYLLQSYCTDTLASDERQELLSFIAADPLGEQTIPAMESLLETRQGTEEPIDYPRWQPILDEIIAIDRVEGLPSVPVTRGRVLHIKWAAAAAILFLLGTGAWWIWNSRQPHHPPTAQTTKPADIPAPATNRATITLGNGRQVYLDSAGNGALAQQGSAQVLKLANGQVAYKNEAGSLKHDEILYNTLTNPRGSQVISLTLTDGTKVWLNAESSLRYPVAFTGADRTVEITGEAYFEVSQAINKPFIVKKGNTSVEVLGTAFNVNAYSDEPAFRVTLLEGKVRVVTQQHQTILRPGQQAQVTSGIKVSSDVDTLAVMAWKNGAFAFSGTDLITVMRQLSRWYDVEVGYEGPMPKATFSGKIGRSLTLTQVLNGLATTRIHYRLVDNHKMIILP